MAYLVIKDGGKEICRIELNGAKVVGRSHECDVPLDCGTLSRRHIRLERERGQWVAIDLDSRHGSFVNAQRITRQALNDGDALEFGDLVARFYEGTPLPQRFETPQEALFAARLIDEPPRCPKRAVEDFPVPKPREHQVGKDDSLYSYPMEIGPGEGDSLPE